MKVSLTIEKGPQQGRVITFEKPGNMLIGRANDADFQLPQDDPYVSRRHVYLEICPPSCRLSNLSNTNPPHVNNQPVDSKDLANGDLIELGYTRIRIGIGTQFEVATKNCSKCGEPMRYCRIKPYPNFASIAEDPNPGNPVNGCRPNVPVVLKTSVNTPTAMVAPKSLGIPLSTVAKNACRQLKALTVRVSTTIG